MSQAPPVSPPNIQSKHAVHGPFARKLAFTLAIMGAFGPFSTDMYLPALPTLARDLGTDLAMVQMTLAIFLLGQGFGQLVWGTLCDHIGRRLPMLAGCVIFTCTAVVCAMTDSIYVLIGARFFMGLGGSAGMVVSRAIVRDLFEDKEASKFYTMIMIIGGIAPIISPFIGSLLLTHGTWRTIFWVVTGYGVVCVAAVLRNIPETLAPENRMHGHFADVFRGYGRILVNRRFLGPATAIGCTSGMLFTYIANSPYIFMELFKVPVAYFGFLFATNSIGLYVGGQSNRLWLRWFNSGQLVRGGLWLNLAFSVLLTACAATGIGGFPALFVLLFLTLSTLGIVFPNGTVIVMQPFKGEAGFASALLGIFQFVIGATGGALIGYFNNGTALPTAIQILCFGLIAKAMLTLTTSKQN